MHCSSPLCTGVEVSTLRMGKKLFQESQDFFRNREIFREKWGHKVIFLGGLRFFDPKFCVNIADVLEDCSNSLYNSSQSPYCVKSRYMYHTAIYFRLSYQLISTLLSRHIACCLRHMKTWSDFVVYIWWQGPCVFPS